MATKKVKTIESLEASFIDAMEGKSSQEPEVLFPGKEEKADGKLEIFVSKDAMQARMRAHKADPMDAAAIRNELKRRRIVFGIDKASIHVAVDKLKSQGGWKGDIIVAHGEPAQRPFQISYPFLEPVGNFGDKKFTWLIDGVPLFSELQHILASKKRHELNDFTKIAVKALRPNDVIVRINDKTDGKAGTNVYNESVKDDSFPLNIGDNIRFDEAKGDYVSEVYGYLCADANYLTVIEPIWISPDKMEAFYINLKQVGRYVSPQYADVSSMLLKRHVKASCIKSDLIKSLCRKLEEQEKLPVSIKIATGFPPQDGKDAYVQQYFDLQKKAGKLRGDDSLDLRERNIVVTLCKGDLIAEKHLPTKGVQGSTLLGEVLEAKDGKDTDLKIGKGVTQKTKNSRILYHAAKNGNLKIDRKGISVVEIFNINSDVDYSTGNIDVKTDLQISGSVGPGFSVRAEGNIQIKGMVEAGASIFAKGNLRIAKGVVGEATKIIVHGDLYAQFVQDAEIMAKGNITIGSYIYNSMVRAGGEIIVKKLGGGKGGRVVGGVVCASQGIELISVGSPTNRNTVVALQASFDQMGELRRFEASIQKVGENIVKMMRTLHLDTVDADAIREKLEKVPPNRRALLKKLLVHLSVMIKQKNSLEMKKRKLDEAIENALEKAKIRVSGEFFQGNEVQIGSRRFVAQTDLGASVFQLEDGQIST